MSTSPLENKTIRPGSLRGFSYYHSNRSVPVASAPTHKSHFQIRYLAAAVVILLGAYLLFGQGSSKNYSQKSKSVASAPATSSQTKPQAVPSNHCAGNNEDKFIKISITSRHLWACQASKKVYDSAVITGLQNNLETQTPIGTYKIYATLGTTVAAGWEITAESVDF